MDNVKSPLPDGDDVLFVDVNTLFKGTGMTVMPVEDAEEKKEEK